MGRGTNHLSVTQFDLLRWVADGCKDGVYEGGSHRVSARALHNRGLVQVSGSGRTWAVKITPDGTCRLQEEAKRIEAERERADREAQAKAERERERQQLRERALKLLDDVVAAGGRLDLGTDADTNDIRQMQSVLAQSGCLPQGQRLAQEPTRMDPSLGVTVYLEPDWEVLTAVRSFGVPRQLRDPHPAVAEFQNKKALVSKDQIGRAARFLQALVSAAIEVGWKAPAKVPNMSRGYGDPGPDLALRLPSRELAVTIRELTQSGRQVQAYITTMDYYTHTERTTANKHFQPSGNLEVSITKAWDDQKVLSLQDAAGASLEEQLPVLIRKFEIGEAEADWSHQEESRRAEIREIRWEEVKQEAFTKLSYQRNVEMLDDQLERRQSVAAIRTYAHEIEARAEQLNASDADEARKWAVWVRQHADRTDPINGPLQLLSITSARYDDLEPHMNGWSAYGPYRR
ncbi:hypothetical protein [Mycobacteroides chelonae]|uniref:hypothetical protein n=1 Tax=Mycobacteroides chelonae TaxID=1774 RepID=UPI002DEFFEBF|nr:hypothetical protein [Mycobacteroides chelonae]